MPLFIMISLYLELDIALGPYYNCVCRQMNLNVMDVFLNEEEAWNSFV